MKKVFLLFGVVPLLSLSSAKAQTVPVGSGSYTTVFPGTDAAGRNKVPTGSPGLSGTAATKPVPTNDWWSNLIKNPHGGQAFNYPLSYRSLSSGLVVNLTVPPGSGPTEYRQPMGDVAGIVVGVEGLNATQSTASNHSDWTITMNWNGGGKDFNAMMGIGMPFTYFTKGSADLAKISVNHNPAGATVSGNRIIITNNYNGANYVVFGPAGTVWSGSGGVFTSNLNGKNYWSMVMLPAGVDVNTSITNLAPHAFVFPSNTQVAWTYTPSTGAVRTTFTVTTDVKEGSGTTFLQGLLPHQWSRLASGSPTPAGYIYNTVRGQLKMLASNTFIVENKFSGILPTLPNLAKYSSGFDPGSLYKKIDLMKNDGLAEWTDSYNEGQSMNRLIQVAHLAHQIGHIEARDKLLNTVRVRLEDWFKAEGGEVAFLFYYNNTWKSMLGYPAGHRQDENLNDHHFHWGYLIHAAAAIEQYQPGWVSQWGGMVDLLIRDASNPSRTDSMFPFLRNFSPYAGHAWANGFATEPFGNDQESTSESMQFNCSLIHWGTVTGNNAIRDLGIYLYTTEQSAVEEYWFDQNDRTFQPEYIHEMVARIWGGGYDNGTWWTQDIAASYGIQLYPIHGGALYMGHNTAYVQRVWDGMKAKTQVLQNVSNDNLWYDTYWSYLAFLDPAQAITLYNNYTNRNIKFGISDAQTYHWLHSMNAMGQVAEEVTANYPVAAVFSKAGVKTYVAHNYGASAITVSFSDGFSMSVPARSTATNRDINVTATLSSNTLQVPTNGTVTLTAATTGSGITKVEFYRNSTLIGTDTSTPYSITTPPLAAGLPNFYARVFVGTSHNVSNVVTVQVGSQIPYPGPTAPSLPGTIEAGNYDAFEGGSGQGVSYSDATPWNEAGYRPSEAVDAGSTTGEGNTVGWIDAGEWLEYTVNVTSGGTYNVNLRYTSGNAAGGGPFWFENEAGTKISPDITVAMNDVNWSTYIDKPVTGVTLGAGTQVIRVKVGNGGFNLGRMTFTFTGGNVPVTGVTVSPTSASFNVGATQQLTATVAPANATNKNVTWTSSNTAVATVNSTGLVTGVAAGTATITVTTQDGAKTATSAMTVTSPNVPVTGVIVSPTSASIAAGSTQQLTATVAPANATNKNVTWTSSNSSVATVNTTGLVTGVAAGTSTITVTTQDGARTATSAITVTTTPGLPSPWVTADIGAVGLTGSASHSGSTFTANGSGADIWGAADEFRYIYQTVTGDVTITARVASLSNTNGWAKAGVMVRQGTADNAPHAFTGVTAANGLAFQRRVSAGAQSDHTAGPAGAAPYWVRLTRAGNSFTSFVSTNGTTWTQVGAATTITITASVQVGLAVTSHNDAVLTTATFDNVTVSGNVPVTGVTVSPISASIAVGATQQLTATVAPATNKNVTWSSNNTGIATVNSSGLVTGVAAGSATITVTTQDGGRTATSAITVTTANVPVTGVTVSPTSVSINVGATQQLTATVAPANATNKNVTWSSNNTGIATVNSTGLVTGVAAGSTTITVTTQDGGRTATSAITVTSSPGVDITNLTGGIVSAQYDDSPAAERFPNLIDNNVNTKYLTIHASAWVQFQAPASYVVTRYTLTSANDAAERDPLNWTLQGSTNGSTWTTINTQSAQDFPSRFQTRSFTFTNTTAYTHYRFNLTNNSGTLLQLAEFELFGTAVSGGGVCTGNGPIASGQSVPDYSYEISTSGNVNVKFIPGTPIAGCDMALFYYRIGTGGYSGFGMTASAGTFTASVSIPNGSAIQFYFTYRRGAGGMESNSSATPHSYTVGATCGGSGGRSTQSEITDQLQSVTEELNAEGGDVLYPNPVSNKLTIQSMKGAQVKILDQSGREVLHRISIDDKIDVSELAPGVYLIIVAKKGIRTERRFIKK